jgi:hypothetical protein
MAYCTNSIAMISYVGGQVLFGQEQRVGGIALLSPRTVINLGPYHVYASQEDFYMFDGSKAIQPVGTKIARRYREIVSVANRYRAHAFHDVPKRQIRWSIPTSDTTGVVYVQEYDLFQPRESIWMPMTYADFPRAYGSMERFSTITWDDAQYANKPWNSMYVTWDQGSARQTFPVRVFGKDNGVVVLDDDSDLTDNGTAVEARWDLIDVTPHELYQSAVGRWTQIEFEAQGTDVEILYSTDGGSVFTSLGSTTLSGTWNRYKVDFDVTARTIRIRMLCSGSTSWFEFRWLRLWGLVQGDR